MNESYACFIKGKRISLHTKKERQHQRPSLEAPKQPTQPIQQSSALNLHYQASFFLLVAPIALMKVMCSSDYTSRAHFAKDYIMSANSQNKARFDTIPNSKYNHHRSSIVAC